MNTVFKNKHLTLRMDDSENLAEAVWTTSIFMIEEEYKEAMLSYLRQLQNYRPARLLVDIRSARFGIVPALQSWTLEKIYSEKINAGIRKLAYVTGSDIFVTVSFEQLVEDSRRCESILTCLKQRFFDDYREAVSWLKAA